MTLANYTDQEVFDTISAHLLDQDMQSCVTHRAGPPGHCVTSKGQFKEMRYKAPDGLKCAIGCMIPDYIYDKSMEGAGVLTLVDTSKSAVSLYTYPSPAKKAEYDKWTKRCLALREWQARFKEVTSRLLVALQNLHDNYLPSQWEERLAELRYEYGVGTHE